jgi:hypothetical protein
MIKINFLISDNISYQIFHNSGLIKMPKNLYSDWYLNMDDIRIFIIDYIPEDLKDEKYTISLSRKSDITNIDVYFDHNKYITRDIKIKKLLND